MNSFQEEWKDMPGYEGRYQVSDQGRVRSIPFRQRYVNWRTGTEMFRLTTERVLSQQKINSGYLIVHLHLDNVREARLVHRIVAEVFLSADSDLPEVNHIDGCKQNNTASNLEWVTSSENKVHAIREGLNTMAIAVICPNGDRYPSISLASRELRVSPKTIRKALRSDGPWRHA